MFAPLVAAWLLSSAASAAAVPAVWTEKVPVPGTAVAETQPTISVRVEGDKAFSQSSGNYIKVDGKYLRSPVLAFERLPSGAYDYTKAYLSARVHWALADGAHNVEASVFDAGWVRHTTTWSFGVAVPPVVSSPVPTPGATLATALPTISARVTDSGPVSSASITVDGVLVPSTFVGGVVSGTVAAPLANDAVHTARVTAVDATGLTGELVWQFGVQVYPPMPVGVTCEDCHVGFPAAHPVDNCPACHGLGSPCETGYNDPNESHEPGGECWPCHGNVSDCGWCHGDTYYATVPPGHDFVDDAYHDSATPACSPCHVRRLTTEHNRRGMACLSCHASADPLVAGAIEAGTTDCFACHPTIHGASHAAAVDPYCEDCHSSDLITEHLTGQGLECATCHESADPGVLAAIDAGDTGCDACHVDPRHDAVHVSALEFACAGCHAGNLLAEHTDAQALACAACHDSADPVVVAAIIEGDTACLTCHDFGDHPYVSAPHTSGIGAQTLSGSYPSGASYSVACSGCHSPELGPEHGRATSSSAALACAACHPAPRDTLAPWDGSCVQGGCHAAGGGEQQHGAMTGAHVVPEGYQLCLACHPQGDAGAIHTGAASSCLACHSSASIPGTLDCGVCHPAQLEPHGYDPAKHTATVADSTISGTLRDTLGNEFLFYDGTTMTYAGQRCGECHLMDLRGEHTKPTSSVPAEECAACHPSPRNTFTTWNKTCQQAGCHASYHSGMATKHYQNYSGREQSCGRADGGCHPGEWHLDLAAVHDEAWYGGGVFDDLSSYPNGCAICHSSASIVPASPTACTTCHTSRHGAATYP